MERWEFLDRISKPLNETMESLIGYLERAGYLEVVREKTTDILRTFFRSNLERTYDVQVEGLENIPKDGGLILVPNHQTWLDVQLIGAYSPRKPVFVAKDTFNTVPFLNKFMEFFGSLYVKSEEMEEGINKILHSIHSGECVVLFPEGSVPGEDDGNGWNVEEDSGVLYGKSGVVKIHLNSGAPIIPVGVSGQGEDLSPQIYPRLERIAKRESIPVTLRFGQPLTLSNKKFENCTPTEINNMTKELMEKLSQVVDDPMDYAPIKLPVSKKTQPDYIPEMGLKNSPLSKGEKADFGCLVLHGFTSHINSVAGIETILKNQKIPYRFPILKGHGTQVEDLKGTNYDDWYSDAENAFLDLSKESEKIIIIGHSLGALLAMELAARYRHKVAGVVALSIALKFVDPLVIFSPILSRIFDYWTMPPRLSNKELEEQFNDNYDKMATDAFVSFYQNTFRVKNLLSFVKAPALIVHSKKDKVTSPISSKTAFDSISSKDKEIVWLEESNHDILLDVEKDALVKHIESFISRVIKETDTQKKKPAPAKESTKEPAKATKEPAKKSTTTKKTTPAKSKAKSTTTGSSKSSSTTKSKSTGKKTQSSATKSGVKKNKPSSTAKKPSTSQSQTKKKTDR